jgi:hypothetical protein
MAATCAYCDAQVRPNSMFCLECGQLAHGVPVIAAPADLVVVIEAPQAAAVVPRTAASVPSSPASAPAEEAPVLVAEAPAPATLREVPRVPAAPTETVRRADFVAPTAPQVYALPAPSPAASGRSRVTLEFSTGERAVVSGMAVIGRSPHGSARNSGAQAIEVQDPTRSVSRVHLYLTVSDGAVTVSDAGSGNGSALERAGIRTALKEGRPLTVQAGDRLWLGDVHAELQFS